MVPEGTLWKGEVSAMMDKYLDLCQLIASYLVASIGILTLFVLTLMLAVYVLEKTIAACKLYRLFFIFLGQHWKEERLKRIRKKNQS